MGRWDIADRSRVHTAEPRNSTSERRQERESASPSAGRGGSNGPSTEELPDRQHSIEQTPDGRGDRRTRYQDRGRSYSLRSSEIEALSDIGRFRALDAEDLARFVYQGDAARASRDFENLRQQGLVEEKTVFRAQRPPRKLLTLTDRGSQMLRQVKALAPGQTTYHGFVRSKDIEHDADLYKVYQRALQQIEDKGGKPLRVRLDFELKEFINWAKQAARQLPGEIGKRWLEAVVSEHGLTTKGKTIHLPDIQLEYQSADGRIERENLELVSCNYREPGIRAKAASGFTMYARTGDTSRVRRALLDSGAPREVYAI
jgi:DNA-binding PadR family transcriptional regulator